MAKAAVWNTDRWQSIGGPIGDSPGPAPEPDVTWDQMMAQVEGTSTESTKYQIIENWYRSNTGHEALGYQVGSLTSGSLSSTAEGQLIERLVGTSSRHAYSNITIRGCRINWANSLYGAYLNPTFGAPLSGITFEYCTFIGPAASDVAKRAGYISSGLDLAVTFRYCNFSGGTSGVGTDRGAIVEYCWIHDLAAATAENGAHRTSLRTSGRGVRFYRNYCTDGGSSCISVYADKNEMHNITVQENILNGSSPNASPSYLINTKQGPFGPTATNVKYLGNFWGSQYQFGVLTGGNIPWGSAGNQRANNRMLATGEPFGND